MKRVLTGLAVSTMIAVPLAASAHDGDGYRGARGYDHRGYYYNKPKHAGRYDAPPPVVYYRPAPPPRVVGYPVYVPAPPPPPVPWPLNQVNIGFRILF